MGWNGGSSLMGEVIAAVTPEVSDPKARKRIYKKYGTP